MSDNKGSEERQYYASYINCKGWDQRDEEYPYIAFYAYDESRFEDVQGRLIEEVLQYASKQSLVPNWVHISEEFAEEDGYCLLKIYLYYPHMKVYAYVLRFSEIGTGIEADPFSVQQRRFCPVFVNHWNVIYRDLHYTAETFLQVFTDFLAGQEPPLLRHPQTGLTIPHDSKTGYSSEGGRSDDL